MKSTQIPIQWRVINKRMSLFMKSPLTVLGTYKHIIDTCCYYGYDYVFLLLLH